MVFCVPLPPNVANSRMHWRTRQRERRAYEGWLDALLLTRQLPPVPRIPWARATVRVAMVVGAAMDEDNAVARCKWPLDWIVKAGYLADDRSSNLTWAAFPEQVVSRKLPRTLTITLEQVR